MHSFNDLINYRNILSVLNPAITAYVKIDGAKLYILSGQKIIDISFMNRYLVYKPKNTRYPVTIGVLYPRYVSNLVFEIDNLILNCYNNVNAPILVYPGRNKYEVIVAESRTNAPLKRIMNINLAPFNSFSFILRWLKK